MSSEHYDVAVVGASLAGCSAATLMARAGLRVALLEANPDPAAYKRLCTTVIQASAVPTIRRLGLDGPIEAAGGVKSALATWTRWGWIRDPGSDAPGYEAHGYDIRREKLDPMIRQLAAGTPGVDFLPGHSVTSVISEGARVVGVGARTTDGATRQVRARVVVGADGRNSAVAKLAGVKARAIRTHGRAGYFAFFRNVELPFPRHAHLWFLEPDVAFAFPHDDGLSLLAVMFSKDQTPAFKANPQGALATFLKGVPEFPHFHLDDQASKVLGVVDYANQWRLRPPPGLAFVGDASVAADPLFGIGCGWALQGGEWLADALGSSLGSDRDVDKALSAYRSTVRAHLAAHYFLISDYSTGRSFNPVEKLTFSAAARDPQAAHLVAEFGARSIPATRLLAPRAVAHAVRVNARPGARAASPVKENLARLHSRPKVTATTVPPRVKEGI